ncbi:MAG: hypothetical protein K2Q20_05480 [Phycisphaerales bacterium]|nr:hypothetical protein [Phycisphaerales bacterium]
MELDDGSAFKVNAGDAALVAKYVSASAADLSVAISKLRTEDAALRHCASKSWTVGVTKTKSEDHHQSAKAMIAAVSSVAREVCAAMGVTLESDPQRRAVWCSERGLHAMARNPDGAVPSLLNPIVVWEIKEYWGKTGGGSKMSDAVYECHLVGRELRDFERRSGINAAHVVFLDGKDQWGARKSDMLRFIDLFHQGLVDHLVVGKEVETEWSPLLRRLLKEKRRA